MSSNAGVVATSFARPCDREAALLLSDGYSTITIHFIGSLAERPGVVVLAFESNTFILSADRIGR